MAGVIANCSIDEESIAAGTPETLIQIVAATNHAVKILEWGIFLKGTSNTQEPGKAILVRQDDAGTSSALTPAKLNDSIGDTLDTTARHDFTAEPSNDSDILDLKYVHPQTGWVQQYRYGEEPVVGAGDRVGLKATFDDAQVVGAYIRFEE